MTDKDKEYFLQSLSQKLQGCKIKRIFCPWWRNDQEYCMRVNEIHRKYQTSCPYKIKEDNKND